MADPQFHVRALDNDGNTIRQLPTGFLTEEAAGAAAAKATRIHGDDHVVCVSLDARDPRNSKNPGEAGWLTLEDSKLTKEELDKVRDERKKAREAAKV